LQVADWRTNPVANPQSAICNPQSRTVASKPYFPVARDLPDTPIRRVVDSFLNLIYPDQCFICSAPVTRRSDCGVCDGCWRNALRLRIAPPRCPSCGLPFQNFEEHSEYLCGKCILEAPPYSGARSFGHYAAELRRVIQELKFHDRRNLVGLMAPLLAGVFFENWGREDFDIVAPVPLHPKRSRERGFNQSELLARSLSRQIALPWVRALVRTRPTLPQVGLSDARRRDNVRNAFRCTAPEAVYGRRVLLIDDVMTTGATVSSAALALLDGGAIRVSVLTVARTTIFD